MNFRRDFRQTYKLMKLSWMLEYFPFTEIARTTHVISKIILFKIATLQQNKAVYKPSK